MLQHEKAEHLEEIINDLMKDFEESSDLVKEKFRERYEFFVGLLRDRKASIDALAEQEAERMAKEITDPTEDKLIKEGNYIENEVKKGNITNSNITFDMLKVGETYFDEHSRNKYEVISKENDKVVLQYNHFRNGVTRTFMTRNEVDMAYFKLSSRQ